MQRRVELGLALICVGIPLTFAPSSATSDEVLPLRRSGGSLLSKLTAPAGTRIGKIGQVH